MKYSRILLMGLAIALTGCFSELINPSNNTAIEEYVYSNYHALEVQDAFEVYVTFSDTEELIEIEASENLLPYVRVIQNGDKLRLKLADGLRIKGSATLIARITTQNINDYEISGASKVFLQDQLAANKVIAEISGASNMAGDIVADVLDVELSGASNVDLSGSVLDYYVEASGASVARGYALTTDNLFCELSGASVAYSTVNEEITIEASGASTLHYKGPGTIVDQNLSGASRALKQD